MKILRYEKMVAVPGANGSVTYSLVPPQEVTSDHVFFEEILEIVKATDFVWVLIERTEKQIAVGVGS